MISVAKEVMYVQAIPSYGLFFLAGDIGGTNSNFGIFHLSNAAPLLLISLHYKSQQITDFTALVQQVAEYVSKKYTIQLKQGCFAAAGIINHNRTYGKPTNLSFALNLHEIMQATPIKDLFFINDFEAVALGLELTNPKDIILINNKKVFDHRNKAFLGAGTGLGKSVLVWSTLAKRYLPVPSEGGHADAAIYDPQELDILNFITTEQHTSCPVSWENILSGLGIQHIYRYLATKHSYPVTVITQEIAQSDFNPDRISAYAKVDEHCKDTFALYARFYARCAKNFALDSLALGGIYIAGGIAAKNVSLFFDPLFMHEFNRCGKQSASLAEVPLSIISDYNVSLYGTVVAAHLHTLNLM